METTADPVLYLVAIKEWRKIEQEQDLRQQSP